MNETTKKYPNLRALLFMEGFLIVLWAIGWLFLWRFIEYVWVSLLFVASSFFCFIGVIAMIPFIKKSSGKEKILCIISFVIALVIMITITVSTFIEADEIARENNVFYKGDFSEYECCECGKPADGGRVKAVGDTDYYCSTHYEDHMELVNTLKCKHCNKRFDRDSGSGKRIAKYGYCSSCTEKYKYISEIAGAH